MIERIPGDEPMCQTSEKGEKLFSRSEMLPIALEIGRRILEVFGYQEIPNIVFRLKSNSREIDAVINGEKLPTTELLLGIYRISGVSIDWLLTGEGSKVLSPQHQFIHAETRPLALVAPIGEASTSLAKPLHPALDA